MEHAATASESVKPSPELMRSIIQRVATGPELSKDISREEARVGMQMVLEGKADPVQAAIFLIALRMKRETDDETIGVLEAIREATDTVTAPVDEVFDIADPYDGYNRTLPMAPFLPAVLAACGVPAVSHGLDRVGPKFGVTHRHVLQAAGLPVDLSPADAAARLGDPRIGWSYVDQKMFCPKLHALVGFRKQIVKRPVVTTVETEVGPIRGRRRTHLMTGYVHKPYPRIYGVVARAAGFDSALIVRGVEGGVIPSLRQTARFYYYRSDEELQYVEFGPTDLGIEPQQRPTPLPDSVVHEETATDGLGLVRDHAAAAPLAAQAGMEVLDGKPGPARDSLVAAGAVCLWHLQRHSTLAAAADAVRQVLDNGQARARLIS